MKEQTSPVLMPAPHYVVNREAERAEFAADIKNGLSRSPKTLSSKYFYDSNGSRLFRKIMDLPEYYLTRTETAIFEAQKKAIVYSLTPGKEPFALIDLGAGDAAKTKILLQELLQQEQPFTYVPVDISNAAMEELAHEIHQELPNLPVQPLASEYFGAMDWLARNQPLRKVVFFLGSNIGNFENKAIRQFSRRLRRYLNPGDQILMGFDLRKEPHLIRQAYDDAAGITAAFNYNLLHRINHEFNGNFVVEDFKHFAEYNPVSGDMKSYLLPIRNQEVLLADLNYQCHIGAWEPIHTETSHKFTLDEIEQIGRRVGFLVKEIFTDERHYFADVVFDVH